MADFPYNVEVDKKFNKSVTVKSLSTDLPNTKTVSYKDIAKALLAGDQQIIYSSGKQNNSLYKTYLTSDKSRYKNSSPSELKKLMSENFIIKLPINQFGVDSNFVSGFFLIPNNVIEEIKETIKSGQPNQADIEKEFNQLKDRTQKIGESFASIVDDLDNFINKDIKLPKSLKEITKSVNDARSELIKNNNRLNALKNLVEKDSDLYKKITELITENKNLIKAIDSAIKPLIKQAELKLNPPMDLSIIETIREKTKEIGASLVKEYETIQNYLNKGETPKPSIEQIKKNIAKERKDLTKNIEQLNDLSRKLDSNAPEQKTIKKLIKDNEELINKFIDTSLKHFIEQAENKIKVNKQNEEFTKNFEKIKTESQDLRNKVTELNTNVKNHLSNPKKFPIDTTEASKNATKYITNLKSKTTKLEELLASAPSEDNKKEIQKIINQNNESINTIADMRKNISIIKKANSTDLTILTTISKSINETDTKIKNYVNHLRNFVEKNIPLPADFSLDKIKAEIKTEIPNKIKENDSNLKKISKNLFEKHPDKAKVNDLISKNNDINNSINSTSQLSLLLQQAENKIKANKQNEEFTRQFTKLQTESDSLRNKVIELNKNVNNHLNNPNKFPIDISKERTNAENLKKDLQAKNQELNKLSAPNDEAQKKLDNEIKANNNAINTIDNTILPNIKQAEDKVKQNEEFTRQFTKLQTESDSLRNKVTELNTNVKNHLSDPKKFPINTSEASKNATNYGNNLSNNNSQLEKLLASAPSEDNKKEIQKIINQNNESINTIADIRKNISIIKKANSTDLTILTTISKSIDDMNTNISKYTANLSDFVNKNTPLPADFSLDKIKAEIESEIPNKIKENNKKLSEVSDNLFEHHPDKAKVNDLISKNNDINNSINSTSRLSLLLQQAEAKLSKNPDEKIIERVNELQKQSNDTITNVNKLHDYINKNINDSTKNPIRSKDETKRIANDYSDDLTNINKELFKLQKSASNDATKNSIDTLINSNNQAIKNINDNVLPLIDKINQKKDDDTTKSTSNDESIKTLQNNSNTARTELDNIETMLNAHIIDKKPLTKNIDEIESDVNRIKTTLENSNTDLINEKTTADKNNDTQTVSEINDTIKKNNKYLNLIDKYIDVCIDYLKPKTINTTNTVNRQKAVDVNTIDSNTEVKPKPVVVNPVTEVKPEPTVTTITDTNTTASSVTDTNTAVKPVTDIKPTAKPVTEVKTESTVTPIDVKPYPLDVSYTTEVKTEPTVTPVTDTNTTVSSVTDINTTAKPVTDAKPTNTPVSDVKLTTTPLSDAKPTVTPVADTVTPVTEVKTEPTVTSTTNKSDDNATYDMIKENYDLFISNFKTLNNNLDKIKDSSIYSIGCLNSIIRDYNELNRSIKVHTQVLSEICSRTNSESDLYINSQSLIEKFSLLINNPDLINNAKIEDKKRELIELINNNNAKYASVKPANTNIIEENTTTVVNATSKPKNVSENSDSSINVSSTKKQVSESKTTSTQNENIANGTSTRKVTSLNKLVNKENTNCTENEYLKHINRINVKGNCSININNNGNSTRKTITLTPRGEVIITKGSENLNTRVQTTNHITESATDRMERRRKERQRRIAERRQRRIDNYETFGR